LPSNLDSPWINSLTIFFFFFIFLMFSEHTVQGLYFAQRKYISYILIKWKTAQRSGSQCKCVYWFKLQYNFCIDMESQISYIYIYMKLIWWSGVYEKIYSTFETVIFALHHYEIRKLLSSKKMGNKEKTQKFIYKQQKKKNGIENQVILSLNAFHDAPLFCYLV